MKKLLIACIIILTSFAGANAQVPDSYKATLLKMFTASGTDQSYKSAIDQMLSMFQAQKPEVPEEVWNEFQIQFMNTSLNDLAEMLAPVYQNHLTESDLEDIIAFYSTPTGKKFANSTPMIMQESMQIGQNWGMEMAQEIQEKLTEKGY